jgi:16S rRNA (adenine1518-N6/adenine1519-N6)-dimethyltransferase
MEFCNIHHIKALLGRHGFHFSKGLGQNFLCEQSVPEDIAAGAGITPETCVLEVGPGIGALTHQLCRRAKHVTAVELDKRLPAVLAETMAEYDNFDLVEGDILQVDLPAICREHFGDSPAVACANLPYYITTPAITALMESGCFSAITVMVQKEVAQRICAKPGTADYGAFTVYVNYHAKASIILDVPRDCFVPAPNVDSAVVRLDVLKEPPVPGEEKQIFRVVKAAFAQRRKTLVNGLFAAYGDKWSKQELSDLLVSLGYSASVRGEALGLEDFYRLSVELHKK